MATATRPVLEARSERTTATMTRAGVAHHPLVLVVIVAVLFFVNASPWIAAGFGESHDGRNAAIWGMSSRALREAPIESRLGGELEPGYTYANHPPLIIAETAAAEAIAGEHPLVTRAPAWLASIAALVLLCLLLLDAGMSATAVAAGVTATFGSAMFLVYGTMLDTPVTSFPFTVALVWAGHRAHRGRPFPLWAMGALGLLAGLSGWQAVVVAGFVGATLAAATRKDRALLRPLSALAAGTAAGLALTLTWIHWVYGSFTPLQANRNYRATGSTLTTSLQIQWDHLWDLFPLALVAAGAGLAFVLRDRRTRLMFGTSIAAIVSYSIVFRGASEMHDYWNFAMLLPLAISATAGAQHVLDRVPAHRLRASAAALTLGGAACLALTLARPSDAQFQVENGLSTVRLAAIADKQSEADEPALAYVSGAGSRSRWIDYETGRPGLALADEEALRDLAERDPTFLVLVVLPRLGETGRRTADRTAFAVDGPYALLPAAAAVDARADR